MKIQPVKMVATNTDNRSVFTIERVSETAASLSVHVAINAKEWPAIQKEIGNCLELMKLKDDAPIPQPYNPLEDLRIAYNLLNQAGDMASGMARLQKVIRKLQESHEPSTNSI